jgi:hypothetical protein
MSLTGFHPLRDKIISQNLQAVADQGCHLEGSSPYKRTLYCTGLAGIEIFMDPGKKKCLQNTCWNTVKYQISEHGPSPKKPFA